MVRDVDLFCLVIREHRCYERIRSGFVVDHNTCGTGYATVPRASKQHARHARLVIRAHRRADDDVMIGAINVARAACNGFQHVVRRAEDSTERFQIRKESVSQIAFEAMRLD